MSDILIPSFDDLIDSMQQQLERWIEQTAYTEPVMIGIHTGGVWLASLLHQALGLTTPLGELDISFYRDDFTRIGVHPQVKTSRLPASLDDQTVILVDDVLQTGRTIRAAMNELFDYGRPAQICLATAILRYGRELPISPDVCGVEMELPEDLQIKLVDATAPRFELVRG